MGFGVIVACPCLAAAWCVPPMEESVLHVGRDDIFPGLPGGSEVYEQEKKSTEGFLVVYIIFRVPGTTRRRPRASAEPGVCYLRRDTVTNLT